MAVTHWYTGIASETTATVAVRASSDENVTVSANSEDKVVACATATNDGNAVATFTGLSPGVRYPYTVNGTARGELRPFPTTYPFWVALSSCWTPNSYDVLATRLLKAPATGANKALHEEMVATLALFCGLGDLVYMNASGTINGYTVTDVAGGTLADTQDLEKRLNYYRGTRLNGGLQALLANVPLPGSRVGRPSRSSSASAGRTVIRLTWKVSPNWAAEGIRSPSPSLPESIWSRSKSVSCR